MDITVSIDKQKLIKYFQPLQIMNYQFITTTNAAINKSCKIMHHY